MPATIIRVTDKASFDHAVSLGASFLREGKLVVFPTETVYGIGCNALNESAVEALYRAKNRPKEKPLLLHLHALSQAESCAYLDDSARCLLTAFTPGPLSIIVKKRPHVPSVVTSGGETVGLRFPDEPLFLAMAREADLPIAATSANLSGFTSAKDGDAAREMSEVADLIIDGGACAYSIESTILSLAGDTPKILREGAISKEMLQEVMGQCL